MIKDQIYSAHGSLYSVHSFMAKDFLQTEKIEEAHEDDPLVKNLEYGGYSKISNCTPLKTLSQEPITNEMVINRLAKKDQAAANDIILKQARLDFCFESGYRYCPEDKRLNVGLDNKSAIFQRARNKALQNIMWV